MIHRLLKNSTIKVTEVLQMALTEQANQRKAVVGAEAVLLALANQQDSIVVKIIEELGLDRSQIRRDLSAQIWLLVAELPEFAENQPTKLRMAQDLINLFEAAEREQQRLGDDFISTGALFLAFFDGSVPRTAEVLTGLGLSYEESAAALDTLRGKTKILKREDESSQSLLDQYTTDVTLRARRGEYDPVLGREEEIERVIEILSRRKKNNPLLIGEPGVGKTVIVEGLANRIAQADVPEYLLNKRIVSLEIGSLLAGARMQGEFEERIKAIRDEILASSGEIILFIDEIHTVVGAGRSGGALDAANMLKPALARGELQCIGATTLKEYKQYIEVDKALARRFQLVRIAQPNATQALSMLQGLKDKYEEHHKVTYADAAFKAAVDLSERYITDRFLPDKAIDLIDEAGAVKRLKVIYAPPAIRALEREKRELIDKKSQAFNEQNFESMARFQWQLTVLEQQLTTERERQAAISPPEAAEVSADDIARLISRQTGIPAARMIAGEAQKLLQLEATLAARVIGQEHAVRAVANAVRRNRAGLRQAQTPIASFLFLGPTGVGKTELAKAIAAELMDSEAKMIRIDMSEFSQRHEISKLIGSPPGYVGYGEGGQLTERVKQQPYSVVLFDEFEKAHPDVHNIFLQILDEGWLTDGEGQRVSFQNCVVIGTSNLGAAVQSGRRLPMGIGAAVEWSKDQETKAIFAEVKAFLRPELINRFDEIIIFNSLAKAELEQILNVQMTALSKRLGRLGLTLNISDAAKAHILQGLEETGYGARPLKRKVEQSIENPVATLLIEVGVETKKKVNVEFAQGSITVNLL